MSQKDIKLKELLSDATRFADLFNGTLFGGKKVLKPNDLSDLPTELAVTVDDNTDNMVSIQRFRDIIKKHSNGTEFVILACENQTNIHYVMPVRHMMYDALAYTEQVKSIAKSHKNKDFEGNGEFISKFKKSDSIIPIITLIIYYGKKQWDGSVDLHGMMNFKENTEYIKRYVPNYEMNLLCITDIEDLNIYNTDIRELFGMLKYSSNKKQMKEYVESNKERFSNIDNLTYGTILAFLDNKDYLKNIKNKVKTEKGGYNMCIAFDQMVEEGIEIGRIEGKIEGRRLEAQKIAFSLVDILDIQTISEKTGLSIEEIEELRQ